MFLNSPHWNKINKIKITLENCLVKYFYRFDLYKTKHKKLFKIPTIQVCNNITGGVGAQ